MHLKGEKKGGEKMKPELKPGFVSLFSEGGQNVPLLGSKGEGLGNEQGVTRHLSGKEITPCVQRPCFDPPRPPRHYSREVTV